MDMSTAERSVDNFGELLSACEDSLCIDHHGDNRLFCKTNLVDPGASATAEIVVRLMELYGEGITADEAAALYTALSTDNGSFRFSSTTAESHRCAEILLEAGAKPDEIDDRVSQNMSAASLRLWGLALSRTETFGGGERAIFWLRREGARRVRRGERGARRPGEYAASHKGREARALPHGVRRLLQAQRPREAALQRARGRRGLRRRRTSVRGGREGRGRVRRRSRKIEERGSQ